MRKFLFPLPEEEPGTDPWKIFLIICQPGNSDCGKCNFPEGWGFAYLEADGQWTREPFPQAPLFPDGYNFYDEYQWFLDYTPRRKPLQI